MKQRKLAQISAKKVLRLTLAATTLALLTGCNQPTPDRKISGNAPLSIALSSVISNENMPIESYAWRVEKDGSVVYSAKTTTLNHTFYEAGIYNITLKAYGENHQLINTDLIEVNVEKSAQKILIQIDSDGKAKLKQSNVSHLHGDPMPEDDASDNMDLSSDDAEMSNETPTMQIPEEEVENPLEEVQDNGLDTAGADEFFRKARQYFAYNHLKEAKDFFIRARLAYESILIENKPNNSNDDIERVKRNLNYIYSMQKKLG